MSKRFKPTPFGNRLRAIRETLSMRQKYFAERLKISGPALSEIENGKYKPGHDFFIKIAEEFNVSLYYLLFGEGNMFLTSMAPYMRRVNRFAVNNEDVTEFLEYFEGSSFFQYRMLAAFRLLKNDRQEMKIVEKEVEMYKDNPPDSRDGKQEPLK